MTENLFDTSKLTIQTFHDSEESRRKGTSRGELARIFLYDAERIKNLQSEGAGVFFTVNPQKEQDKRGTDNTTQFARVALDLDIAKESQSATNKDRTSKKNELFEKLKNLPIPPNKVFITKNGVQPLWELSDPRVLETIEERRAANEQYKSLVLGICKVLGHSSEGDSIARVIRLPGTLHLKIPNDPYKIEYQELNKIKPAFREFLEAYPPIIQKNNSNNSSLVSLEESVSISEGERHIKMQRLAVSLLSRRYKPEEAWQTMVAINQTYKDREGNSCPLDSSDMQRIFTDACSYLKIHDNKVELSIKIPTATEFLDQEFGDIEWLIEDLVPVSGTAAIVAKRESFKTWLAIYIASCVTSGQPLWGKFKTNKSNVLYVASDDPPGSFRKRLNQFAFGDSLFIYHRDLPNFSIDQQNGSFQSVKTLIKEKNIGVIIIDILRNTHNRDSNTDKDAKFVFDKYKELRENNPKLVIIFIIHPSKENPLERRFARRQVEEAVGSYYWEASVDTVLSLTKAIDEQFADIVLIAVTKNKQSEKKIKPFVGIRRKLDGVVEFIYEEKVPEKLKVDEAKEAISTLLEKDNLKRQEILDQLVANGVCSERTGETALSELVEEGKITHTETKPHVYSLVISIAEKIPQTATTNSAYGITETPRKLETNKGSDVDTVEIKPEEQKKSDWENTDNDIPNFGDPIPERF